MTFCRPIFFKTHERIKVAVSECGDFVWEKREPEFWLSRLIFAFNRDFCMVKQQLLKRTWDTDRGLLCTFRKQFSTGEFILKWIFHLRWSMICLDEHCFASRCLISHSLTWAHTKIRSFGSDPLNQSVSDKYFVLCKRSDIFITSKIYHNDVACNISELRNKMLERREFAYTPCFHIRWRYNFAGSNYWVFFIMLLTNTDQLLD